MQIDDDIALDLAENERIQQLQKVILTEQNKIKERQSDYLTKGSEYDYEVRNIGDALYSAREPVESLTEAQIRRMEWLAEIMELEI